MLDLPGEPRFLQEPLPRFLFGFRLAADWQCAGGAMCRGGIAYASRRDASRDRAAANRDQARNMFVPSLLDTFPNAPLMFRPT
jgi:hypothetical protein